MRRIYFLAPNKAISRTIVDELLLARIEARHTHRHAKDRGCFLELNAHPDRLDLLDSHCQMAKEEGVLVSINSDAHSSFDFANLRYGVGQARRGWLEKDDVLNTRPLEALRRLLRRTL
jgi:DNA polymerase (family 10)